MGCRVASVFGVRFDGGVRVGVGWLYICLIQVQASGFLKVSC